MSAKKDRVLTEAQQIRSDRAKAQWAARKEAAKNAPPAEAKPAETSAPEQAAPAAPAPAESAPPVVNATTTPDQGVEADAAPEASEEGAPESADAAAAEEPAVPPLPSPVAPDDGGKKFIHVHFLDDGATFGGKVWYRGEELKTFEGDQWWNLVHDRNGNSILNLTEDEQWDKFGKHYYAPGPWPGKGFDPSKIKYDGSLVDPETKQPILELQPHEIAALEAANKSQGLKV